MLTDTKIKAEVKAFAMSPQRTRELVADGRRGSGRLVLTMRRYNVKRKEGDMDLSSKFAVEWYVRFHMLNGDRRVVKIGNYDAMGLGDARQVFNEEYAPKIARGDAPPKGIKERRREPAPRACDAAPQARTLKLRHDLNGAARSSPIEGEQSPHPPTASERRGRGQRFGRRGPSQAVAD